MVADANGNTVSRNHNATESFYAQKKVKNRILREGGGLTIFATAYADETSKDISLIVVLD